MASQSGSIVIGLVLSGTSAKHGFASTVLTAGALESANAYAGGSSVSTDASLLRTKLPRAEVPFGTVQKDGTVLISTPWYRFFDFISNVQLGGPNAPTVADLSTATVSTKTQAIAAQTAVASVSQQVNANAQALGAAIQVTQVSALPGSNQIPPVVYTPISRGVQR
jgi:hypothetical protein